jgi:hypothetical protein
MDATGLPVDAFFRGRNPPKMNGLADQHARGISSSDMTRQNGRHRADMTSHCIQ